MFLIASSGRCATKALCSALDEHSDHAVAHEPALHLLQETAWRKHKRLDYDPAPLHRYTAELAERPVNYGESFRAQNLLPEVAAAVSHAKLLILVRDPADYVRSAHAYGAGRRNDAFDQLRLFPPGAEALPYAARMVGHWRVVNTYLLDFAETGALETWVLLVQPFERIHQQIADFLGVRLTDQAAFASALAERRNAAPPSAPPEDYDADRIRSECAEVWDRAARLSR